MNAASEPIEKGNVARLAPRTRGPYVLIRVGSSRRREARSVYRDLRARRIDPDVALAAIEVLRYLDERDERLGEEPTVRRVKRRPAGVRVPSDRELEAMTPEERKAAIRRIAERTAERTSRRRETEQANARRATLQGSPTDFDAPLPGDPSRAVSRAESDALFRACEARDPLRAVPTPEEN